MTSNNWACVACTFENHESILNCEMCDKARPSSILRATRSTTNSSSANTALTTTIDTAVWAECGAGLPDTSTITSVGTVGTNLTKESRPISTSAANVSIFFKPQGSSSLSNSHSHNSHNNAGALSGKPETFVSVASKPKSPMSSLNKHVRRLGDDVRTQNMVKNVSAAAKRRLIEDSSDDDNDREAKDSERRKRPRSVDRDPAPAEVAGTIPVAPRSSSTLPRQQQQDVSIINADESTLALATSISNVTGSATSVPSTALDKAVSSSNSSTARRNHTTSKTIIVIDSSADEQEVETWTEPQQRRQQQYQQQGQKQECLDTASLNLPHVGKDNDTSGLIPPDADIICLDSDGDNDDRFCAAVNGLHPRNNSNERRSSRSSAAIVASAISSNSSSSSSSINVKASTFSAAKASGGGRPSYPPYDQRYEPMYAADSHVDEYSEEMSFDDDGEEEDSEDGLMDSEEEEVEEEVVGGRRGYRNEWEEIADEDEVFDDYSEDGNLRMTHGSDRVWPTMRVTPAAGSNSNSSSSSSNGLPHWLNNSAISSSNNNNNFQVQQTPSFPEISAHFWSVDSLRRSGRCAIDFSLFTLSGSTTAITTSGSGGVGVSVGVSDYRNSSSGSKAGGATNYENRKKIRDTKNEKDKAKKQKARERKKTRAAAGSGKGKSSYKRKGWGGAKKK